MRVAVISSGTNTARVTTSSQAAPVGASQTSSDGSRVLESAARLDSVRRQLDEYFEGRRSRFDLKVDWRLSHGFQRRVLSRTARIPYGEVSTYKTIAAAAGSPRGQRRGVRTVRAGA